MNHVLERLAVAVLLAGCGFQAWFLLGSRPSFVTLPIFTPVSLEYERAMRLDLNQPAGQGGAEATALAQALAMEDLDPTTSATLAPRIAALRETREELLELRNQRHALNIALMDVGVALTAELSPEQWDHIQMNRDGYQARQDGTVFDRLSERLGKP